MAPGIVTDYVSGEFTDSQAENNRYHYRLMKTVDFSKVISDRLDELGTTAFAVENDFDLPSDAIRNVLRSEKKSGPTLGRVVEICEALDLDFHIGPKGPRENLTGFAEAAVSLISPTIDGSPEALRMGFLPLPYNFYEPKHRGVSPLAFARAWLIERDLSPENLSIVAMPGSDMSPSISPNELLLVDDSRKLAEEPELAAYLYEGRLGVGWAMKPTKGSVVVLFERRFSPPIVLNEGSTTRYRHLGGIAARFDSLPSPWLSLQDKHAALERGRELVAKR